VEGRPLVRRDLPEPEPGPDQVKLRVLACGVCHTDVHVAEGDLEPPPGGAIPGHQIVGEVVAAGAGAGHRPGDRVGVTWLGACCDRCSYCREGRENLCSRAAFTGWQVPGGFARYTVARHDVCVPLPSGPSPLELAPLLCAGVVGYRAFRLAGARPGERLGLLGFGASARLVLQVARHRGCEVVVFSRRESHADDALSLGAAWAGPLSADGRDCHAIVSFAPVGDVVPEGLRHLRPGGALVLNAVHLTDVPPLRYELLFGERSLRSVSNVTRADAREFLALAADGPVRAQPVSYPFERANEALADVKGARVPGHAVLEIAS